jgi:lipid-A-disaccharide synthase
MLDSLEAKRLETPRETDLVGLFPGSRGKEIRRIFPVMIEAAELIQRERPGVRFEAAAASHQLADQMLAQLRAAGRDETFCAIRVRSSHELMQRAAVGMVCSGTATLEAAFFRLPLCVIYKVAWLTYVIGRRLVRVPFLGMPNVLAGREIAREFLQRDATGAAIGGEMLRLLGDAAARDKLQADLAAVIRGLGSHGAAQRAAAAIAETLQLS